MTNICAMPETVAETVECGKTVARLSCGPSGELTFVPSAIESGKKARHSCWLCGSGYPDVVKSMPSKIAPEQIIGAIQTGCKLEICYMPLEEQPIPVRQFKKCPELVLSSPAAAAEFRAVLLERCCCAAPNQTRKLHVFINPVSGNRRGSEIWKRLAPILRDAAGFNLLETTSLSAGHVTEVAGTMKVDDLDGLVVVGGDGTVYEVLQGLLKRSDWEIACKLPLVQVPAGSGNALAASCHLGSEYHAAYAVIKGHRRSLDAATVLRPGGERSFSFLTVTTGLLANSDFGTEHLRWLGELRFTLGALYEIFARRSTRVRISVLPQAQAVAARADDLPGTSSHAMFPTGPPCPILKSLGMASMERFPEETGSLPAEWEDMSPGPFQLIVASNLPWLATSFQAAPPAELSDGAYTLVWTTNASIPEGIDVLLKMETGDHIALPPMNHMKVGAMVFEPLDSDACLVVDGELLPTGPIYLEVHSKLLSVFVDPQCLG